MPRSGKRAAWLAVVVVGCALLLSLLVVSRPARIPATHISVTAGQIRSRSAKPVRKRGFGNLYRRRILADLMTGGQIKRAWAEIKGGREQITALTKEPDGHFFVQATNRQGGFVSINYPRSPTAYTAWHSVGPPVLSVSREVGYVKSPNRSHLIEQRPPKEDTYTITSVLQVLKPANPTQMTDDFQEARVWPRTRTLIPSRSPITRFTVRPSERTQIGARRMPG